MIATDYVILVDRYSVDLETQVKERIAQGWAVNGAPFIWNDSLCQSMVKFPQLVTAIVQSPTIGPYAVSHWVR